MNEGASGEQSVASGADDRDAAQQLRAGLVRLDALYRDLLRAALPANPQFERERIIASTPNPRELVFLLGLLNEGENEAALVLELAADVTRDDPAAPTMHLIDEAWYYLRTSIDARWQLDDGEPSAPAALAYLLTILGARLDAIRHASQTPCVALRSHDTAADRRALLQSLRGERRLVDVELQPGERD